MEHPPTPALLACVTLDEHLVCLHGPFFVILNKLSLYDSDAGVTLPSPSSLKFQFLLV